MQYVNECITCILKMICVAGMSASAFMSQHAGQDRSLLVQHRSGFLQDAAKHVAIGVACLACVLLAMLGGESDLKRQVRLLAAKRKRDVE